MYILPSLLLLATAQASDITTAFERFNQHSKYKVKAPSESEQKKLLNGRVVTRIDTPIPLDAISSTAKAKFSKRRSQLRVKFSRRRT